MHNKVLVKIVQALNELFEYVFSLLLRQLPTLSYILQQITCRAQFHYNARVVFNCKCLQ